jgi:D-galactose 1-dehydrogenase
LPPYSIAVIGVGDAAQTRHLSAIRKNPRFKVVGLVSPNSEHERDLPCFRTTAELYDKIPNVSAMAVCTPPYTRYEIAHEALKADKHLLLESPPTHTIGQMHDLSGFAAERRRCVFAPWHSQYNAAVDETKKRLIGRKIRSLSIVWNEDVRQRYLGQDWIWDVGNLGVFNSGIDALSILTKIMPDRALVESAELSYPSNRETPISASLVLKSAAAVSSDTRMTAEFDWARVGDQRWDIDIETDRGDKLQLTQRGLRLTIDGATAIEGIDSEYEAIYERFSQLLDDGQSEMDNFPFELVAAALRVCIWHFGAPFDW